MNSTFRNRVIFTAVATLFFGLHQAYARAELEASKDKLSFLVTPNKKMDTQEVEIKNPTVLRATVTALELDHDAPFSVTVTPALPVTLSQNEKIKVAVSYQATGITQNTIDKAVNVVYNWGGADIRLPLFKLSAYESKAVISTTEKVELPATTPGTSPPSRAIEINNFTAISAHVELMQAGGGGFLLQNVTNLQDTKIPPVSKKTFTVTVNPGFTSQISAALWVVSDDPSLGEFTSIPLSYAGITNDSSPKTPAPAGPANSLSGGGIGGCNVASEQNGSANLWLGALFVFGCILLKIQTFWKNRILP